MAAARPAQPRWCTRHERTLRSHCCALLLSVASLLLAVLLSLAPGASAAAKGVSAADLSPYAQLALNLQGRSEWQWPSAERGKGKFQWVLSPAGHARGVTYLGTAARLRRAVDKLRSGKEFVVSTIGGSITAGQGAVDAPNWPQWVANYMQDEFGERATVANGAVGGTLSSYMSVCLNIHVPKTADIVFVEYNQNDPSVSVPPFNTPQRKQFERLLRKLLLYPNRPAVVLMHSYTWMMPSHQYPGIFYGSAEREFQEMALYYDLPALSVKGCCHQLMAEGVPGFITNGTRNVDHDKWKNVLFNYDNIHPDGNTGMRIMAELALSLIDSTLSGLKENPLTDAEVALTQGPLPEPMIQHNYQSLSDTCFIGQHFTSIVVRKDGFEWVNDAKGQARSKWGMVATEVGAVLQMKVSTMASASGAGPARAPHRQHQAQHHQRLSSSRRQLQQQRGMASAQQPAANAVLVELAYLQSYDKMGRANVSCLSGCQCETTLLEGHTKHRSSQTHLHTFFATQSPECVIQVKVREDTTIPGNHKVKVSGLMVSEEVGSSEGIRNHMAVEYVHDVSFQSKDATFDVKNHV